MSYHQFFGETAHLGSISVLDPAVQIKTALMRMRKSVHDFDCAPSSLKYEAGLRLDEAARFHRSIVRGNLKVV